MALTLAALVEFLLAPITIARTILLRARLWRTGEEEDDWEIIAALERHTPPHPPVEP